MKRLDPPPTRTEPELADWRGLSRREPAVLTRFFDVYFPRVYRLASRWVGDRGLAEDLTQDVFLRVQQALPRFDEQQDPWPWLVSIARNLFVDSLRLARNQREEAAADLDPAADHAGPADDVLKEEKAHRVRQALASLPEDQREAVLMRDFGGLSHAEIARRLGLTDLAVRKRYSRALATLADRLKEASP